MNKDEKIAVAEAAIALFNGPEWAEFLEGVAGADRRLVTPDAERPA